MQFEEYNAYVAYTSKPELFDKELDWLGVRNKPDFIIEGKDGTAHLFSRSKDITIIIVTNKNKDKNKIYGLLIHEAVHAWQQIMEHINEPNCGDEIEARGIQFISQFLISRYNEGC